MARLHVRRGMPLKDVDELKARQLRAQQQQQQPPYGGRESQGRYVNNRCMRCCDQLSCWKRQVADRLHMPQAGEARVQALTEQQVAKELT